MKFEIWIIEFALNRVKLIIKVLLIIYLIVRFLKLIKKYNIFKFK